MPQILWFKDVIFKGINGSYHLIVHIDHYQRRPDQKQQLQEQEFNYKVLKFSNHPGKDPRVTDQKIYNANNFRWWEWILLIF
jgi:hypothetical protein